MSTLLLKTKFYIPEAITQYSIAHPFAERLDHGLAGKLTLVAAPAGFGKTTLMSCWIRNCSQIFAWVSLDEADNDPPFSGLTLSAHSSKPARRAISRYCQQFDPVQLPPTQILLTTLINELTISQQKIVLVLDDYHVISNSGYSRTDPFFDRKFAIAITPYPIHPC